VVAIWAVGTIAVLRRPAINEATEDREARLNPFLRPFRFTRGGR
jgi:hypothetical protein